MARGVKPSLVTALTGWLSVVQPVCAESLFVIDHLRVGVHEQMTPDSIILELLPSDTEVQALKRDQSLVKVKTPEGTTGWVDATYLTPERPARVVLAELEVQHAKAQERLTGLQAEVENLRAQLAHAKAQAPQVEIGAMEALARLEERDQALEETVALRELQLAGLDQARETTSSEEQPSATAASEGLLTMGPWIWGAGGGVFLVGFLLGTYVLDYRQRKRHGGFRI